MQNTLIKYGIVALALLTTLGAAGAVWGLHLADVTGDLEAWAIMINLFMAAQGAGTIWHLWHAERPAVSVTSERTARVNPGERLA